MEKQIKITAKLYKCRDTAKSLLGDNYNVRLQPYIFILKNVMKDNNLEEIPALLKVSNTMHFRESGMTQMLYMAAVVEIIEPSQAKARVKNS